MDYLYIRAWGAMMHSFRPYIEDEVERARKDKAPQDAVYKRDGRWVRYSEVTAPGTRYVIDRWVTAHHDLIGVPVS